MIYQFNSLLNERVVCVIVKLRDKGPSSPCPSSATAVKGDSGRHGDLHEHSHSLASKTISSSAAAVNENSRSVRWIICTTAIWIACASKRVRLAPKSVGKCQAPRPKNDISYTVHTIVPSGSCASRRWPRVWGKVNGILHDPRQRGTSCSSAAFPKDLVQSPSGLAGAALPRTVWQSVQSSQYLSQCVRTCL